MDMSASTTSSLSHPDARSTAVSRSTSGSELASPNGSLDPLGVYFADPESHLSDPLYLFFRRYKKELLWRFMQMALDRLELSSGETLHVADVGASMGYDVLFLLRKLTRNFREPLPCHQLVFSLVEGERAAMAAAEHMLKATVSLSQVHFCYHHHPLVERLPLPDASQHVVICSEVLEHLEEPEKLLFEIFRILKPGGFFLLTTDNSPSFLQYLRRLPVWFRGRYRQVYARPCKESEVVGTISWNGREYPIFGHINLNSTRQWEAWSTQAGFELASYGTYESIRRGGGSQTPLALAGYFLMGALVYYCLPRSFGRFFGDTAALLLKKSGN